jgi:glycosyltransferase involved in cell wall biosynthesis
VRFVHRKISAQIVLGNNLRHLFNWIIPDERIFVVANGGNYNFPKIEKDHGDNIHVLFLGNFIGSKGVLDVLKAGLILNESKERKNVKFIFAGSWRDLKTRLEFEKIMTEHPRLPVEVKGTVTGEDKLNMLASADIFVFPTYYPNEGHPWVIIEAMAAGLPVISTNRGAIIESVRDGKNGFIVEPRNPHQVAEKIEFLIENPETRKQMGRESKKIYLENLTEDIMVERLQAVFENVLKASKPLS